MINEKIDWIELRKKVEQDLKSETKDCNCCEENCPICDKWSCDKADTTEDDCYDFNDEHGIIDNDLDDEEISAIAWNNRSSPPIVKNGDFLGLFSDNMKMNNISENNANILFRNHTMKCSHYEEEQKVTGEGYIYPIDKFQNIYLCKKCNAALASKMLEQLALETFI